jgi:carboxymethylenebutenolidase
MGNVFKIDVGGNPMDVYLGAPARQWPGPVIVLMYHRGGIDDFTKYLVDRLVSHGYLVAVPDVYHRCPGGTPLADRKSFLRDSEIIADVRATIAMLHERRDVASDKIVLMGHCMGGRMALLVAGNVPGFCGVIDYYGGSVARSWGEGATPFDALRNIACPIIGFFGNEDRHPSPEDVNHIDAELTHFGIAHEFYRYDGVGHGFQNPAHDAPQEREAAEDAWAKTFAFLGRVAPVSI